ncbi:MAG: HAD family hydrolase [Acidobacteriota bacterium]
MKPLSLLFDFGGTLDTDGRHWSVMFRTGYCLNDIRLGDEEFARAYVEAERLCCDGRIHHSDGLFATLLHQTKAQSELLSKGRTEAEKARLRDAAVKVARWSLREVGEAIHAVRPLLVALHDRYRLGLISNFYGNLAAVCDELGILPMFDCVIDSDCVGCRKPGNRIFRVAMEALGDEPHDVAMIGDSYENDIIPARQIGCRTIWLEGEGWKKPGSRADADFIIHSVLELPAVLETMK